MTSVIDYGLLRGVITALVFAAFIGVCLWAWSSRRKADFEEAAKLALDDDHPPQRAGETTHEQ